MKIAVLYGGVSKERAVSISSSEGIITALKENGHDVIAIDFNPANLQPIIDLEVDMVFIGLHGKYGEDGSIQGLLDMLEIPYVGSGVLASALAMDKFVAKQLFEKVGIPVAKGAQYKVQKDTNVSKIAEEISANFSVPFVIKPNREGSTLGLTIVKSAEETEEAILKAALSDDFIIVEQFIAGRELTVPVMGKMNEEEALPIIEIIPKNELYDFEAKYAVGGSEHIIPAELSPTVTALIKKYAVSAHRVLGCETYSRTDFILTEDNIPYILETNTLPGMTATSLFPDSAKEIGLSYPAMIEQFIQLTKNK